MTATYAATCQQKLAADNYDNDNIFECHGRRIVDVHS
jgi:hypothetical protein